MNSCRSIEFVACAPPLITFIIGTGSVVRSRHRDSSQSGLLGRSGGRLRGGERDAENRVRAERGPCSACRRARSARGRVPPGRARRRPRTAVGDLAVHVSDGLARRPCRPTRCPPSRSSTASCTPVDAPDGTIARPSAPGRRAGRPPRRSDCRASRAPAGRAHRRSWSLARLLCLVVVRVLLGERKRRPILARLRRRSPPQLPRASESASPQRAARARGRRSAAARR